MRREGLNDGVMAEETKPDNWTRVFCGVGFLLILAGAIPALIGVNPDIPWFAPIVLGIVAFTFGLTFQDAHENDQEKDSSVPGDEAS